MASACGLRALALTDHDCVDGWDEFRAAADGFEPVCGVEVSARRKGFDVHVLGLFVEPRDARFARRLNGLEETRQERTTAMIDRLRGAGVDLDPEAVRAISPKGTIGRPHLALALVHAGAAESVDDAFRRYLRPGRPGHVPKNGPSPEEAIEWIHDAGGVAVLAHPGLLRKARWIEDCAAAGLDGIEVWHPKHNAGQRERFLEVADRLDLVPSGGSDYHGRNVGDAEVGQEPVPADLLEALRGRRSARPAADP